MSFDKRSLRRIINSVHATERMKPDWEDRAIPSGVYRFVLLEQVTPDLGDDIQTVRADILSMDALEILYPDYDLWFVDNTLFGEKAGFLGVCTFNNDKFWYVDPIRGIPYYNDSGMEIPAYGAIQITPGASPEGLAVRAKRPDSFGVAHPGLILINSETSVAVATYGIANTQFLVARLNNGEGDIAVGDDVGPRSGSFDLWRKGKGFTLRAFAGSSIGVVEPNDNVLEIVKITNPEPDLLGFYEGMVQRYDPISLSWVDLFECKVMDANR